MGLNKYILLAILVQFNRSKCFECPGYSIPRKFRCDAVNNCGDNSDEEGCPTSNTDYLDEDETREAELLSQIAELEQKLLEAELPKKEARIRSSLGILRNSSQKEKDEVDKSELESQIVQLEQKLSEAELTKQEALNQLGQVQAKFEESSASAILLKEEKLQVENEVADLKKELNELENTIKERRNDLMKMNPGFSVPFPMPWNPWPSRYWSSKKSDSTPNYWPNRKMGSRWK